MKIIQTGFFIFLFANAFAQTETEKLIRYSEIVKDSFEIYITKPTSFDTHKTYNIFYYCDANLKSGKKLRELINDKKAAQKTSATIFIGIGHIGNFHVLRRRDFILPAITDTDTVARSGQYGQTENFYLFLTKELMPDITKRFKTNGKENSILGHSLGGLFVFYCLFKNETIFTNYYALSPSLWVDNAAIYKFNQLDGNNNGKKKLYFSAGGKETLNLVKPATDKMDAFLKQKRYNGLQYNYKVHKGKTHNSQVEKSLEDILF